MKNLILIICVLQTALAAPQLITFKDGKVGVNFFGYHAEAGLGGGQNGQNGGLLGGLHASAGTPWGQNAAAGLGGNVNGRAAGVLYAGAQATPDVGASAVLGGDTSQGGFSGSEAYANGKVASRTRNIVAGNSYQKHDGTDNVAAANLPSQPATENVNAIQKIRPPKKYYSSETLPYTHNAVLNEIESSSLSSLTSLPSLSPVLTEESVQPLNIDANNGNGNNRNHQHKSYSDENSIKKFISSPFAYSTSVLSSPSKLSPTTPASIHSSVSLNHSNENNSNGINAQGVNDNDNTAAIIITRTETKLRNRQRNHPRHNTHPKRHRSKTIVKVVKQKQQTQHLQLQQQNLPPTAAAAVVAVAQQQNRYPEKLLPIEPQQKHPQIYYLQQRPVRRQLIAPPPPPPHPADAITPCDASKSECKTANREVRSDVVQSALQIPIGILQSLQQSLGNLGHH